MKRLALIVCLVLVLLALAVSMAFAQGNTTTLTLYHFSDYHSHALPAYSEGKPDQGGIARVIGYLRSKKLSDPNALVFNGGDMMNAGSPSWSDKYMCSEWDWFNGLAEAMALGNHEFDYGQPIFQQCLAKLAYPILNANLVKTDTGDPVFQADGKPYMIVERDGVRLGVFAVGSKDYQTLIRPANLPANTKFADVTETTREIVRRLREEEKVDAVVSIGHRSYEEDLALAQAVPGIDLILGTHSHRKEDLKKLPGTNTWFISPYQFGTYVSRVQLAFANGKLANVSGGLVPMDKNVPEAPDVAEGVAARQADLEADPFFAPKFVKLGSAAVELSDTNLNTGEAVIGNFVMDLLRQKAGVNFIASTSSSFRAGIPPGDITVESYQAALPFRNLVVTYDMTGAQIRDILNFMATKTTTDSFLQQSGVRLRLRNGQAEDIQILRDPSDPSQGYEPLDDAKVYKVGTTDFAANIHPDYKRLFGVGTNKIVTPLVINDVVIAEIKANSPVSAALDGRVR
ncbi:MAG: bifunctional metallophosphatase/5'-nucleotidase [Anaerolineae bacterium]|nr:bifunctional metallophosphatase/5'-nucleotidase [Anaerolineae bacterium]